MATIHNEVLIDAERSAVWAVLSDLEGLATYDPVVHKSRVITDEKSGVGAARRCTIDKDGFFEEKVSIWEPEGRLEFSLYACSQPMKELTHTYTLEQRGSQTHVAQVMRYTMKFGPIGVLMDWLMGKRLADKGIKLFMAGLKRYVETGEGKPHPVRPNISAA